MTKVCAPPPEVFDAGLRAAQLQEGIADAVLRLGRRGAVVAVSGGVDSGVVAALCARALGPEHVMLLRLPEEGLGTRSADLGRQLATALGTPTAEQGISAALEQLGCYDQQRDAVRAVVPDYESGWPFKLVRSAPSGAMTVFSLVVERPDGSRQTRRVPAVAYRELLAATNMKQRVRTLVTYTWADRLHAAVAGTPNLIEYDQGFFVKGGDGLCDVKPIAGLYKQQVYALARYLDLPEAIAGRAPTTETFTLAQSQEEFYFGYPLDQMDLLVWGVRNHVAAEVVADRCDLTVQEVEQGYREVARRQVATAYLHAPALVLDDAPAQV
ncbi:MAG: synthetase [Frankiales bacterium]|nr:synthetase [Frankiales bacterium]